MVQYNSKSIIFHKQGVNLFPREINLRGQWECALVECAFRKSWDMLPYDQAVKLLYYSENQVKTLTLTDTMIMKGDYEISSLVGKINTFFEYSGKFFVKEGNDYILRGMPGKKITQIPMLSYDERKQKVYQYPGLINGVELLFIGFDQYLGEVLGFPKQLTFEYAERKFKKILSEENILIDLEKEVFSIFQCKRNPVELLYITADMIEYSLVDNRFINLLRILNLPKNAEKNELIYFSFETPIYFHLTKNNLNGIEIRLNNYFETSLLPMRTEGDFYFVLHFRRIKEDNPIIIDKSNDSKKKSNESTIGSALSGTKDEDEGEVDPFLVLSVNE